MRCGMSRWPAGSACAAWRAGAFRVGVGVRDAWIGWDAVQCCGRLHLVANNSRFPVPGGGRVPNLASRALGPGMRRLPADMRELHGHTVLLAETFMDRSRLADSCYRAANRMSLGFTKGFSRLPGGAPRWTPNGQPRDVYVHDLCGVAATRLSAPEEAAAPDTVRAPPARAATLHTIRAFFEEAGDFRAAGVTVSPAI